MVFPEPECRGGYIYSQVAEITGDREDEFWAWMAGQTMMICGGPDDGAGERNCTVAHGMPVVYPGDLKRFCREGQLSTEHFELWRVSNTEAMILKFGTQEIRFGMRELDDLKSEIRGWELRYYDD